MKTLMKSLFLLLFFVLGLRAPAQDRQPVFAGPFYPAHAEELRRTLTDLFSRAETSRSSEHVVAIISPHAGYVFSGEVAAAAFARIDPDREYESIFILASSHRMAFDGASIYARGDLLTPLGRVKVDKELCRELIRKHEVFVDRPEAHAAEHSLEVQLPFLQHRLSKDFRVVPIVIGTQNESTCRMLGQALKPYLRPGNLFVISTDFSHYPSDRDAREVDASTARAIAANDPDVFLKTLRQNERKNIPNLATGLCGWSSVLTLMYMTGGREDVRYHLVAYRNSGDSPYGEKDRVVGYHAIAVTLGREERDSGFRLSPDDRRTLLTLARNALSSTLKARPAEEPDSQKLSDALKTPCGAFVTLEKHGDLRGCIGQFEPGGPLHTVVQQMAVAAALKDPRFPPVRSDELNDIEIEISVLTPLRRIRSVDEFTLGKHGIYVRQGMQSGTLLPQVAEQTGWSKEEFLGHCARDKAGIGWDGWKDAELYVYEAIVFSERDVHEHR